MGDPRLLPDCRTKEQLEHRLRGKVGVWVPIYCANCGGPGGEVPEENMTFAFYLCNKCVETHGAVANTMMMPDEVFWAEVAAEQEARRRKEEGL